MDKNIDFSNQMELEHILGDIDLNEDAPVEEPARQYYFIAKARKYITEISAKLGRPLFSHVETFGCQMNARASQNLAGPLLDLAYIEPADHHADFVIYNTSPAL